MNISEYQKEEDKVNSILKSGVSYREWILRICAKLSETLDKGDKK